MKKLMITGERGGHCEFQIESEVFDPKEVPERPRSWRRHTSCIREAEKLAEQMRKYSITVTWREVEVSP